MCRRICHRVSADKLVLYVHVYMVFVAVIPFPIPFGPLGIGIFLAPFGFLPVLGNLTLLYPGVLFPAVSLLRRRNNAGINNLPLPGGKSACSLSNAGVGFATMPARPTFLLGM